MIRRSRLCEVIWGSLQRIVVFGPCSEHQFFYSSSLSLQIHGVKLCQSLLHLASMSSPSINEGMAGPVDGTRLASKALNLGTFAPTSLVNDVRVLVQRFGYHRVECTVGRVFGCLPAPLAALSRPDILRKVVPLGHPFLCAPKLPLSCPQSLNMHQKLGQLGPPRKNHR